MIDNPNGWLVHVVPVEDMRTHDTDSENCWCSPHVEHDGTIVHNSLDGREAFETGQRLRS